MPTTTKPRRYTITLSEKEMTILLPLLGNAEVSGADPSWDYMDPEEYEKSPEYKAFKAEAKAQTRLYEKLLKKYQA